MYLLTVEKLLGEPWPRDALTEVFAQRSTGKMPPTLKETMATVSYLARKLHIDRIVPMDDFDVETAAALREHFRLPGMGDSTARHFRDKLAMRVKAADEKIPVPAFVPVFNHAAVQEFVDRVPPPWMNKPRSQAGATGITKVKSADELFKLMESQGDDQSHHLLEAYLPGDVYHVDSLVADGKVVFAECHRCGAPPFNVAHGGGIYSSVTVKRDSADERALKAINKKVLSSFGLACGAAHVEFIKGAKDGKFYLLEAAARVGGVHIGDLVEASTGINLWAEWANLEIDNGERPYKLPKQRKDYAGLVMTLAKQERADTSAYDDPEVVFRSPERYHAGLIVRSKDHARADKLITSYVDRFQSDFMATLPAASHPSH
ncbi:MAG: ATP-grasp domain-containing protein [Polyangiaceae bacterium]